MARLRFTLASVLAPVLVAGLALGGGFWASAHTPDARSSLASAIDSLPADVQIAGFTDWARIRERLALGSASTSAAREKLTNESASRDLSTRSVIGRSIQQMHTSYRWSAADVDWEVYGQAQDGASMVAQLDSSVLTSAIEARLPTLGYTKKDQVWQAGEGTLAKVGTDLGSTLGALAVLPGRRLVVAASSAGYVRKVLGVVDRQRVSLLSDRSAADVAGQLVGTDTALLQAGSFWCQETGVSNEGADVKAQARAAVARAGTFADVDFGGRGIVDRSANRQTVRFALAFDSPAAAAQQLRTRTSLTTGAFIGRSGSVESSFALTGAGTEGSTLALAFDHDPNSGVVMVGNQPILFAGCPG